MNTSKQSIIYTLYSAGHCTHSECITIQGGSLKSKRFPALCAHIHHPLYGDFLFDTGYTQRFYEQTKKWPFCLYRKTTPVYITPDQSLVAQLRHNHIPADAIQAIFISHFHADHIGGLKDFPKARFMCSRLAYETVKNTKGLRALMHGYLADHLPDDFESRLDFIEDKPLIALPSSLTPFTHGYDLLGDNSCLAIFLPGHAKGQFGLYFETADDSVFLVADSCWSTKAYQEGKKPHRLTALIHDDWEEYIQTLINLTQLSALNPTLKIIPSHCSEIKTVEKIHA